MEKLEVPKEMLPNSPQSNKLNSYLSDVAYNLTDKEGSEDAVHQNYRIFGTPEFSEQNVLTLEKPIVSDDIRQLEDMAPKSIHCTQSQLDYKEASFFPLTDSNCFSIKNEIIDLEDSEVDVTINVHNPYLKYETKIKTDEVDLGMDEIPPLRNFQCEKCKRKFFFEFRYRAHMIYHALSCPPFQCDECPFKCIKRKRLTVHLRSHTNEKKIPCKICKDYYYYFNVTEHFQKCPKPKRYNCEDCEYATGKMFFFERHRRMHTGERLKCWKCDLGFLDNVARKKHYKVHTREKPYECHICYKQFKMKDARERHVLAYCDRKCTKCDYMSINCSDFYEHVKVYHWYTKMRLKLQRMFRRYENSITDSPDYLDLPVIDNETECPKEEIRVNNSDNVVVKSINVKTDNDFETIKNVRDEVTNFSTENYAQDNVLEYGDSEENWHYGLIKSFSQNYANMDYGNFTKTETSESIDIEDSIDYDLIQNVKCELTEVNDNYTLLCL